MLEKSEKERRDKETNRREDETEGGEKRRHEKDRQLKEPTGGSLDKISRECTPLMERE